MENQDKFAVVLFFERNEKNNNVFDCTGRTQIMSPRSALEVYANTPNPASHLILGKTIEEVDELSEQTIKNMMNPAWVIEYDELYL